MYTQQEIIDIRQMIWDAKSEGPEAIVALMCDEKYLKHSALQCRAIRGLRSVAITSKDGRHRVLKADAQHTIVEAMKNHEDNHHVVRWGCRALPSLYASRMPPRSAMVNLRARAHPLTPSHAPPRPAPTLSSLPLPLPGGGGGRPDALVRRVVAAAAAEARGRW